MLAFKCFHPQRLVLHVIFEQMVHGSGNLVGGVKIGRKNPQLGCSKVGYASFC